MTVRIEKEGRVWTVIHSRAESRNAMDPESADALVAAFQQFDSDADAAVAVLWGEGGAFCAGWDLKYCATMVQDAKQLHDIDYPLEDRKSIPRGPLGPTRLELDKPVIAAVAGPAVAGGFELALWCDVRVMEQSAYFGVYCRRWGVPLIDRGTVRLPRIVGMGGGTGISGTFSRARRSGSASSTRLRCASLIVLQVAISSRVRPQPAHTPRSGSMVQTLMHGDFNFFSWPRSLCPPSRRVRA